MREIVVADLLQRLGIEARREGREHWAWCPVHIEHKTPSWQIHDEPGSPKHGFSRCFGCGFGSGPIGLVRAVLGLGSKEARAFLESSEVSRVAETVEIVVRQPRASRFQLPLAAKFLRWPSEALSYLEARGVDEAQRLRWGLGFVAAGRLSGRVLVVVRDEFGRPRSYTARTFIGAAKRWLEPRAAERAEHEVMLGEQLWPEREERDRVVVVEGSFDAFAVDAATRFPVAAIRGAQLLPRQALMLSTFERVTVCGDPDKAGAWLNAQVRAIGRHRAVDVVTMPDGLDPAALFEQRGARALRVRLGSA